MDWLLLRGLARESAHWGDLLAKLRYARPQDRFHTLDLPGTGLNNRLPSPTSISEIRAFVEAAAQPLPRPLALLGMSLGGMVAMDWVQRKPEDCAALVLIGTSSGLSRPWHRMRPSNWPRVARLLLSTDPEATERGILALTSNRDDTREVGRAWLRIQQEQPVTTRNVLRQLYAASRFKPPKGAPEVPALLLASQGDRLVDWRCSQALSRAWGWPLALHPSAGHDLPLDDPDWVVQQINGRFPPV